MKIGAALVRFGAIALIPASGHAAAQPDDRLDVIVVTATRQAEPARTLPQSVAVLPGDMLRGADSAEDIVMHLPGVQAAISNGSQTTFQIRGVGAVDHQALTPSAAAVSIDGVFLATNVQASLLTYDLEQVEVLKGPQGTVQGRNASSGSINFITTRPSADPEGYVSLSYGRFDRLDFEAAASGQVVDGINGRVAGRYLTADSGLENVGGPPAAGGERDEYGLRGALEVELGAGGGLLLRAHAEADRGVNPAPLNSALSLGRHEISVGADGVQDTHNDFRGASAAYTAEWAGWAITSLSAVEGFKQRYGFDFDGTPAAIANLSYDRDYTQFSQEISGRREWSAGSLLMGFALSEDEFKQDYLIWCGDLDPVTLAGTCTYPGAPGRVGPMPASPAPAVSLLTRMAQQRRMGAVYALTDIRLGQATTLTIGGRQTFERIDGEGFGLHIFSDGIRDFNNRSGLGAAIGRNVIDEDRFTGMAALRRQVGRSGIAYASFGQGYKSGGFNGEVANNATHYQDAGLFAAETVNAYEIGFKGALGNTVSFNAAAFHQDYAHPQARIFVAFPLPGGASITSNSLSNLDAATVRGVDLSAEWLPLEGLRISAGAVILESEIEQGTDAAGGGNAAAFDGNPLPFASDVSATFGVRQAWTLAGERRMSVELNAKYQSAYYLDPEGRADRMQDAVTLVDARAALQLSERAEVSVWGRNLTNEDYALSGYGFIGYDTFRSQPATWGISLRLAR